VAEIEEQRLDDPHVAYFAAANPGHRQGDELACLTRLDPANLTPAGSACCSAADRRLRRQHRPPDRFLSDVPIAEKGTPWLETRSRTLEEGG
jgi:hypothetical protein